MGQNVLMSGCKSSSFRVFLLSRKHTPWRETQRDQTRLTAVRERGGHGAASGWRPGAPWAGERSGRDGTFTASRHLTVFLCYFLLFEGRCLLQLGGAVRRAPGKAGTVTREGPGCCPRPGTPLSALSRAGGTLRQRLRTQVPVLPQARTGPRRIGYFCLRNQMVVFFCQGRKRPDTEACGPVHVRTRRAPGAPGGATALAGRGSAPCATVRLSTSLNLSVPPAPPPPHH